MLANFGESDLYLQLFMFPDKLAKGEMNHLDKGIFGQHSEGLQNCNILFYFCFITLAVLPFFFILSFTSL